MNPDNLKPLYMRETEARSAARLRKADRRHRDRHNRHLRSLARIVPNLLRDMRAFLPGIAPLRQPTGPNDIKLRSFRGLPKRNKPGKYARHHAAHTDYGGYGRRLR